MNFDDFKNEWEEEMNVPTADTLSNIKNVQKIDRRLKSSFIIEIVACIAIFSFVVFAYYLGFPKNTLVHFSLILMAAASILIPYKLIQSRRTKIEDNWTLKGNINKEIQKLEKQRKLLSGIVSWYLGPLTIAIITGSLGGYQQRTGTYVPDQGLLIYWCICAALFIFCFYLNKRAANKKIKPILEKLKQFKTQLEE